MCVYPSSPHLLTNSCTVDTTVLNCQAVKQNFTDPLKVDLTIQQHLDSIFGLAARAWKRHYRMASCHCFNGLIVGAIQNIKVVFQQLTQQKSKKNISRLASGFHKFLSPITHTVPRLTTAVLTKANKRSVEPN